MDKFAYVVTVTPAGSLLVNGAPAAPSDGNSHSSEELLAWALDQVRRQWEAAGTSAGDGALLRVTIDDQRPGGYGRHRTRLRPGQAASIEGLRARTGRNLEHWRPGSSPAQRNGSAAVAPVAAVVLAPTASVQEVEPPAEAGSGDEAPPQAGWIRYSPRILRPRLPAPEKAAPKQRQSPVKLIMVAAATLIIAFLAFSIYDRATQPGIYAAVCVDQRTAARVNTDAPCRQSQAAYFRWWYVPAGSAVPAVGAPVDPQQGSFIEPTDSAPVRHGYAAGGGVYKQPKD